jgi:hypothetical protein
VEVGSVRLLSSAALAVACWRRAASDFRFGFGVVWVAAGGWSDREQAPSENTQASEVAIRIVFIDSENA